ncbi:MAG: VTT domain-containing protein [Hyphomicrobium sp.]|jgi:membrane protein DedA with SNARE-associated domain
MTDSFVDTVLSLVREGEGWAIPIAFLVAFGESLCFLSIIWPGWAILTGLAFLLAASGAGPAIIVPTIVAASLGGIIGYSISYWVGYRFKDRIGNVWPFTTHPTLIPRGEEFFNEHGLWSVFLGHFVGPVRAVIPVVAGMFAMPQVPFQVANIASAVLWAVWVILWPVLFVTYQQPIFAFMRDHEVVVALVMFTLAFANGAALPMLFVPVMVLFAFVGGVHLYAGGSFWIIFLAGAAGAFCADLFFYKAGARAKGDFSDVWFVNDQGRGVAPARKLVREQGVMSVITSKLHGMRRALVPIAAGAEGAPLPPYAVASLVSAVLWSGVLLLPGLVVRAFAA